MSKDVVATSENIQSIIKMLNVLQSVKDDSSKLREISLDNTGWEGMDASSFNTALNNFTQKLDKTANDMEEALSAYKSKQEAQLEKTGEDAKTADKLDVMGAVAGAMTGFGLGGLPGAIAGGYIGSNPKKVANFVKEATKGITSKTDIANPSNIPTSSPSNATKSSGFESPSRSGLR